MCDLIKLARALNWQMDRQMERKTMEGWSLCVNLFMQPTQNCIQEKLKSVQKWFYENLTQIYTYILHTTCHIPTHGGYIFHNTPIRNQLLVSMPYSFSSLLQKVTTAEYAA